MADLADPLTKALNHLRREAALGTEWTADGCGYSVAIVGDESDAGRARLIWYDGRGPTYDLIVPLEAVAEQLLSHFGMRARRCDGDLAKAERKHGGHADEDR